MSFDQLSRKAASIMKNLKLESPISCFLFGMICQQITSENTILHLIDILQKVENLQSTIFFRQNTAEQILFLLYQQLHSQQSKKINELNTPNLSREGSPELGPSLQTQGNLHQIVNLKSDEHHIKNSVKKTTSYWDHNGQMHSEASEMDKETLDLISKIQEQDREEQLKLKSQVKQQEEDMECPICCESLIAKDIYPFDGCNHVYCMACLINYLEQAMKERRINITCPSSDCKNNLTEYDIGMISGKDKQIEYIKYTLDQFVDTHADQMSWCPTPDCGYAFVIGDADDDNEFHCPLCKKIYCLNCRVTFHKGATCKEYQISNTRDINDVKFEKFVKGRKFKSCTKCKFWVEKNQGCDHMTCRCGYEFCYKCGGKYMECECVKKAQELHQQRVEEQRIRQLDKKRGRAQKRK